MILWAYVDRLLVVTAPTISQSEGADEYECQNYQKVHATMVWGRLSPLYFDMPESDSALLNSLTDILVAGNDTETRADVPFNSIGHYSDRVKDLELESLWKFFSPAALSDRELAPMFSSFDGGDAVLRQSWDTPGAYPVSRPLPKFPKPGTASHSFVLDEFGKGGVYYPSALVSTKAIHRCC